MNRDQFQDVIQTAASRLRADSNLFLSLLPALPILPPGSEYLVLQAYIHKFMADAEMTLRVPNRDAVVPLLALFRPMALYWLEGYPFPYRPLDALTPDEHLKGTMIFPVVYTAYYDPALPEEFIYQSGLTWFWRPIPPSPLRVVLNVSIQDDPAKVYPHDATGLPPGIQHDVPDKDTGRRHISITWPHDVEGWYEQFTQNVDNNEDEWSDLLEQ